VSRWNRVEVGVLATVMLAAVFIATAGRAQDAASGEAPQGSTYTDEAPFLAESAAAMESMMVGMDIKPTGDVDADFVAVMIPHHH